MTSTSRIRLPLLAWGGWLFISLFLQSGPLQIRDRLQSAMQASSAFLLDQIASLFPSRSNSSDHRPETSSSDSSLLAENRELLRRVAELREENLQLRQAVPYNSAPHAALVTLDVIPARIIGRRGDVLSDSLELLISLGKEQGLVPGELVLSGRGLLIDQGAEQGLTADQLLTSGRALFGRTIRVGKRTTLVQPMTDIDFRMAVRIVRRSSLGIVQGPGGILAGTGSGCRLEEVSATEAVAAGDEVYTDRLVSPAAEPIYCGRIVSAKVASSDSHWTIEMVPLHSPACLPAELSVLKTGLKNASTPPGP